MAKQVIDVYVGKGMTSAQSNEHLRNRSEKAAAYAMTKGNYDPTRERLNFEITKGGKVSPIDKSRSIPERMAAILRERGIKDPNEGMAEPKFRTVVNFIFGGGRERMQQLAFGNQQVYFTHGADNSSVHRLPEIEQWAQDVYAFVSDRYGEENIAAFVVHCDELNPHVHCTLLPIKDGRFAYKQIFAGKDKYEFSARMKQLHSDFAEVTRQWGLERGSSIMETGARHRSTEEYRRELSERNTQLENSISQGERTLASLQTEIRLAERRAKGLNSMIENLLGGYFIPLFLVVCYMGKKQKLEQARWLLWAALLSIPLAYVASEAGWMVAELGRQPWAIQDILPVTAAVSSLPVGSVQFTFFLFLLIFTVLLIAEVGIMLKAIKKGPQMETETV